MEDIIFLKIFVLSIINLLSFILSIYFLVSLYYTKILDFYYVTKENTVLSKTYRDLSVSFSFQTICFICFTASLFVMIFKRDLTSLENKDNNDNNTEVDKFNIYNMNIFLIFFLVSQFFYLLNLILISVGSSKIKYIGTEFILSRDKYISKIYKNVLIVGYIFFLVFLVFGIWAFIFAKERFNFLSKLNSNNCNFFERYFNDKIKNSPGKIKEKKEKIAKDIEKLKSHQRKGVQKIETDFKADYEIRANNSENLEGGSKETINYNNDSSYEN